MIDVEIVKQVNGFVGKIDGIEETAKLTFESVSPGVVVVDHTFVPEAMRGKGIAGKLAAALVLDARTHGYRFIPECSYLIARIEQGEDWADVIAYSEG